VSTPSILALSMAEIGIGVLVPVAILVYWIGSRRLRAQIGSRNLEPKGRGLLAGGGPRDKVFAAAVERAIQRQVITSIAEAQAVPVMVRGVLTSADGNLGGKPGHACIYRNRAHARRDMAVAAEFVTLRDATGKAILENLEAAAVISESERISPHFESISLYLGDEVEVIATFTPERHGDHTDPRELVYGSLGQDGNLHVRVVRRGLEKAAGEDSPATQPTP